MTVPNFIIFGVGRSGTTSFYRYLRQHPDVFMSSVKETNFYAPEAPPEKRPAKTRTEYERCFAGATTERAIGEASPRYFNSETAPERIREDLPGVRLIVSVRHPADRAYSMYLAMLREAHEHRPVSEVLVPGAPGVVAANLYAQDLRRWYDRFPREQIHAVVFDDFVARPADTMREMFRFIGVDPNVPVDVSTKHNTAVAPRSMFWNRVVNRVIKSNGHDRNDRILRMTMRRPDPYPPEVRRRLVA
jgi:hypothetical protein